MLRGYDFDGVLNPRNVEPIKPYVVITSRRIDQWELVRDIAGVDAPIYLNPYPKDLHGGVECGIWKGEMIQRLGIEEFYEDQQWMADIIKQICPNVKIIMVESNL